MNKPEPDHFDKLGNRLAVNDVVAVAHRNSLMIARVIKLNSRMLKVKEFKQTHFEWDTNEYNKYPFESVKINEADAVIYILKNT